MYSDSLPIFMLLVCHAHQRCRTPFHPRKKPCMTALEIIIQGGAPLSKRHGGHTPTKPSWVEYGLKKGHTLARSLATLPEGLVLG